MSSDKKPLGKGLSALISDSTISLIKSNQSQSGEQIDVGLHADKVIELPIDSIEPNINQPRKTMNPQELENLSAAIAKHGVLQPILVKRGVADKFQIIAGERRWRAAKMGNFITIPAIIKDQDEKTLFEIAIIENIQREDLKPLEEAEAYQKLIEHFGYTQENLSSRLGKSRVHVTNMLRLLRLPTTVKTMIAEDLLTAGHARALVNSEDPFAVATEVVKKKLSVRQTEELARGSKNKHDDRKESFDRSGALKLIRNFLKSETIDVDLKQIEETLENGLKVSAKVILEEDDAYVILHPKDFVSLDRLLSLIDAKNK